MQLFTKNVRTVARYLLGVAVAATIAASTATLAGLSAGLLASHNLEGTENTAVYPNVVILADNPVDDSGLGFFDKPGVGLDDPTDIV